MRNLVIGQSVQVIRCSGNLCDETPRAGDGAHYYCQCGSKSVLAELRAQGVNVPNGHWVHVFAKATS